MRALLRRFDTRQIGTVGVIVALFLAYIVRTPYPAVDSAFFEFVGRKLVEGQHLYSDLWDTKLPSIFYLNAIWWLAFGPNYYLHAAAEIAVVGLTVFLFARVVSHFDPTSWPLGTFAFCAIYLINESSLNQTERYATPLILLAVLLHLKHRPLLAGVVLVAASTFWVPSILTAAVPILLFSDKRRRSLFAFSVLLTLGLSVVAMELAYGKSTCLELVQSWFSYEAQNHMKGRFGQFNFVLKYLNPAFYIQSGILVLVTLIGIYWRRTAQAGARFAFVWSVSSVLVVFALGRSSDHYFLACYPPLALLFTLQAHPSSMLRERWHLVVATTLALFVMCVVDVSHVLRERHEHILAAMRATGGAINREYGTGSVALLPWEAYLYSDAMPPGRFSMNNIVAFAKVRDKWIAQPGFYADTQDFRFTKTVPSHDMIFACGDRSTYPIEIYTRKPMRQLPCKLRFPTDVGRR